MQLYFLYLLELPKLVEWDLIWLSFKKSKPFIEVFSEESFRIWRWGTPDLYDWIGAGICLVGVSVMIFVPHQ
jgi:hypothetical protein